MKDIDTLFFELIRVAIGTQDTLPYAPSKEEWMELYAMAKKQSLVGIAFAGLQRLSLTPNPLTFVEPRLHSEVREQALTPLVCTSLPTRRGEYLAEASEELEPCEVMAKYWNMPEMLYLKWMGMAAKIQQRNEIVNKQCVELQGRLAKDGFRSCILKGQGVAALYKQHENEYENENIHLEASLSMLRQSGDIDLYVDCGREKTLAYLESMGMRNLEWDYMHTHAPFYQDTEVEVHYRVSAMRNVWKNRSLQKFWKENEEEFFIGEANLSCGKIVCPSKKMHLLFLIHHAYRHLISGGIGLRQMMDIYFALMARDKCNDEWLKAQVIRFGMKEFCEAMIWVMREVFGMGMIGVPWTPNEREGRFLLDEIMIGGNFGKNDKRFGEGRSKRAILKQITRRNWHLMSHYGSDALAAPFYYVWHYCWKRLHR